MSFLIHYGGSEWPSSQGLCVCHTCDNPPCVNPRHLWLGTAWENMQDAKAKGRPLGSPRLVTDDVEAAIHNSEGTPKEIGIKFGVHQSTVRLIKRGVYRCPPRGGKKGKPPRITPDIVRAVKISDENRWILASRFGITANTVSRIRRNEGWYATVEVEAAA